MHGEISTRACTHSLVAVRGRVGAACAHRARSGEMDAAGVAVGALIAPKRQLQTLIKALDERSWRKRQRISSVDGGDGDLMAVAVVPAGARALDMHVRSAAASDAGGGEASDEPPLPEALARMLDDGVQWASGMRVGAASSAAAPPPRRTSPPK